MQELKTVLDVPAEMIQALAMGLDPPITIVQRYGFELVDLTRFNNQPWFADAVMRERERLRDEGYTFQARARLMNELVLEDLFTISRAGSMRDETKLEFSKHLADMTGMRKPPAQGPGAGGPQFQINIQIPVDARGPTNVREMIQGEKAKPPETLTFDVTPTVKADTLGPRPAFVPPDFNLSAGLAARPPEPSK